LQLLMLQQLEATPSLQPRTSEDLVAAAAGLCCAKPPSGGLVTSSLTFLQQLADAGEGAAPQLQQLQWLHCCG